MSISRRMFLATAAAGSAGALLPDWMAAALAGVGANIDLGVCQPLEHHALIKKAGFQFLEGSVAKNLVPKSSDEEFAKQRAAVAAASLPLRACSGFIPAEMKVVGPAVDLEALVRYATVALQRAKAVGVTRIVFGSGNARQIPDGFARSHAEEQFVAFGRQIAPVAQSNGVIIVLENLQRRECNFVNRVAEGLKLVEAVNHPGFQMHADIFHMLREDESPEAIIQAGARLQHCHIATQQSRRAPGVEPDDFRPYLKALKTINYRGGISLECGWMKLEEELPRAYRVLRVQLDSA